MFTASWGDLAGPTIDIVLACAAVLIPLDRPNDRANWPIPEARTRWGRPRRSARPIRNLCESRIPPQNKKYRCAIGSLSEGSQMSNSPSARTS
jgi:hypothetical protein